MFKLISILIIILILIIFFYSRCSITESFSNSKINIIQTWKTKQIPQKYQSLVSNIKKLNPECNYLFFTDQDIKIFIKDKFHNIC